MIFSHLQMAIQVRQISTPDLGKLPEQHGGERNAMRRAVYFAVVTLVSFGLSSRAQSTAGHQRGIRGSTGGPVLIIQMPEPSSPALLAIDLLSVGALILLSRRRVSGTNR